MFQHFVNALIAVCFYLVFIEENSAHSKIREAFRGQVGAA